MFWEAFRTSGDDLLAYLVRHLAGDWGDVDEHDRRENELSPRLASAFRVHTQYGREVLDHHGSRPQRDDLSSA